MMAPLEATLPIMHSKRWLILFDKKQTRGPTAQQQKSTSILRRWIQDYCCYDDGDKGGDIDDDDVDKFKETRLVCIIER